MEGKFIAYYRVSTKRQGDSGLGLGAQEKAVQEYLNGGAWSLLGEYQDVESGKDDDRPELLKAIAHAKKAKATLVIAKLDRLSRKVSFIADLMDSAVEFVALDYPKANAFVLHIAAAFAQEERRLIADRTKKALAEAKRRGVRLGNPRIAEARAAADAAKQLKADQFAANVVPVIEQVKASGHTTLRDIAAALNARGIKTRRGLVNWTAIAVSRVVARA